MSNHREAFLDIETTGLSRQYCDITVVGINLVRKYEDKLIQLVGADITVDNILEALKGVSVLYTYNGHRFDLPFIDSCLGVDLAEVCMHHDLMYDCWQRNLLGGLKAVERQLGIHRQLTEIHGFDAVRLWWRYINDYDENALSTLLEYNREDVLNLKVLKEMLL